MERRKEEDAFDYKKGKIIRGSYYYVCQCGFEKRSRIYFNK